MTGLSSGEISRAPSSYRLERHAERVMFRSWFRCVLCPLNSSPVSGGVGGGVCITLAFSIYDADTRADR